MTGQTALRATQGIYWLFLGLWLGCMIMLAVGAAITFKTVKSYEPTIGQARYNHPDLRDRASGILAGGITGNILKALAVIQGICIAVLMICIIVQCTVFADYLAGGVRSAANLLRIALIALPILIFGVDTLVLSHRIWTYRETMYDPAQTVAQRDEAKSHFDRLHSINVRMGGVATVCLIAAVLVSPFAFTYTPSTATPSGRELSRG